tara:strand:- start:93 stop:356 length:264 start_codon:yes stop_codon:yes gene_type:complete
MPNISLNGIDYELVSTVASDMSSTNVLRTIVAEGETSVNTYRLNLASYHPQTMKPFASADNITDCCVELPANFWSPYFADPEPEESE